MGSEMCIRDRFQSVALPNGLIGNLYGPVGKCNLNYYLSFRKPEISVVVLALVITIIIIVMKIRLIFRKHTENAHRSFQHETTENISYTILAYGAQRKEHKGTSKGKQRP